PTHRRLLSVEALESRLVPYATTSNVWPHPGLVTISFVPDGTWMPGGYSNLFSTFNARLGSPVTWQGWILAAAQSWEQQTNINFSVIPDNGWPIGSGAYEQGNPLIGDIRIGGYNFGTGDLASASLPPPVNNFSVA